MLDSTLPESDSPATEPTSPLDIDIAPVSVVDGVWQDEPDNIAAFAEHRLGDAARPGDAPTRGRGRLYILLDVSGDAQGRAEIERALIETIRREYAARRGSITFGLSEALRAANTNLYDVNLSATREQRRMAGASALVLRGHDLYIAQAGPAVVYVETAGALHRYPTESDWFTEDSPLISPQGNASAPLGVRREFACDLAHVSVNAGDVFVLATRGLTQLASTEELAHAFADRGVEDIADSLEELGSSGDLSALVAELIDPLAAAQAVGGTSTSAADEADREFPPAEALEEDEHSLDLNQEQEFEPQVAFSTEAATPFAAPTTESQDEVNSETAEERLGRLREERRQRREAQLGSIGRAVGGVGGALVASIALVARALVRIFGVVDWRRLGAALSAVGARIDQILNQAVGVVVSVMILMVKLVLPGAPARTQSLIPRRAPRDPVWLKAVALVLPVVFLGLAGARFVQQNSVRDTQFAELVQQAQALEQSAENNSDKNVARTQLNQALVKIGEARQIKDSGDARTVFYKIKDQLSELDGVGVMYFVPPIPTANASYATPSQVVVQANDVFVLDRGQMRVYHYVVNDSATDSKSASGSGQILQAGDLIGDYRVDQIRAIAWADAGGAAKNSALVAVTGAAILRYDLTQTKWQLQTISDAAQWRDIRAVDSFLGNVYLLDATARQLYKYLPTDTGYNPTSQPYLPANSGVDFSQVVALAIDGDVWMLRRDGAVLRFRSGQAIQFQLSELDRPLKEPSAIFVSQGVDSIYVADAGNQRVVQFDKNGKFVRQFRPSAEHAELFNALKSLFVDESLRRFYFVNGSAVYLANVPK